MTGFGALLRKELLESWRTLRLPATAGVLLLAGFVSPLLAKYTPQLIEAVAGDQVGMSISFPPPTVADSVSQLLKNAGQFGAIAAILLSMGAVAGEMDRGTAAFILVKPATRVAFLAAKLVSIGLTLAVSTGLAVAAAAYYTAVLFEPLPLAGWVGLAGALWLSLTAYASIAFLGSAVARSTVAAAAIGVAGLIALGIASVVPTVAPLLPGGLAELGGSLALGRPAPDLGRSVLATVGLIAVVVLVASWQFQRREL